MNVQFKLADLEFVTAYKGGEYVIFSLGHGVDPRVEEGDRVDLVMCNGKPVVAGMEVVDVLNMGGVKLVQAVAQSSVSYPSGGG